MITPDPLANDLLTLFETPVLLLEALAVLQFDLTHRLRLQVAVHAPNLVPVHDLVLELFQNGAHLDVALE